MALDKASFPYERTPHVIETSLTSSSSSFLLHFFFLSLPGRGRPPGLAAPPEPPRLAEHAWGPAARRRVPAAARAAELALGAELEPAAARSRRSAPGGRALAGGGSLAVERALGAEPAPVAAGARGAHPRG